VTGSGFSGIGSDSKSVTITTRSGAARNCDSVCRPARNIVLLAGTGQRRSRNERARGALPAAGMPDPAFFAHSACKEVALLLAWVPYPACLAGLARGTRSGGRLQRVLHVTARPPTARGLARPWRPGGRRIRHARRHHAHPERERRSPIHDPAESGTAELRWCRRPVAADFERRWPAYSDRSTCADLSDGDGASAIRLSRTQIARLAG